MPNAPMLSTLKRFLHQATHPSLADALWGEGAGSLADSEDVTLDALERWTVPAILADGSGAIIHANPAAVALTGFEPVDMAYHAPLPAWRWRHEADPRLAPGSVCGSGSVWRGTAELVGADGCAILADCAVYPLGNDAGDMLGLAIVLRDRTAARCEERLGAMNIVSGRLAHDLNNLLTIQIAYSQMLVEELDEGSLARDEAMQVLRSVRRLMDLSRKLMLSSGRVTPGATVVDLGVVAETMAEDLADQAPPDVETALTVAPGQMRVRANAEDIDAMLRELVRNALEAVGLEGSVAVTVRPYTVTHPEGRLEPGEYVLVAIGDSGPGVSADQRDHLCEPLYAHKRGGVGTGLGLALARGVAIAHGGLLRLVENPSGLGARFEVLLPAVE